MRFSLADVLPGEDPDRGDYAYIVSLVSEFGDARATSSRRLSGYAQAQSLLARMHGVAVSAIDGAITDRLITPNTALDNAAGNASAVLQRYVREREDISQHAHKIRASARTNLATLNTSNTRISDLSDGMWHAGTWSEAAPAMSWFIRHELDPAREDSLQHAIRRQHAAHSRLQSYHHKWQLLQTDRGQADRQIRAKITNITLPKISTPKNINTLSPTMFAPLKPSLLAPNNNLETPHNTADAYALLLANTTPNNIHATWNLIDPNIQQQLTHRHPFLIANTDGLPASTRDKASRQALNYALAHPDEAYKQMEFSANDLSDKDFKAQLKALKISLEKTKHDAKALPGGPVVQMLGFDNHNGAITTAISIGNVDTADNIGINVPGMGAKVDGINNALGGAKELFKTSNNADQYATNAVITWYGYRTPSLTEVLNTDRAKAGAPQLARFIDGIYVSRTASPQRVVAYGHSYGSTTTAEALKLTRHRVTAFVTYGSAGLDNRITAKDLNTKKIYATQALGDGIADWGKEGYKGLDPRDLGGATVFSAEGGNGKSAVTTHDMFTDDDTNQKHKDKKIGYLNNNTSSVRYMGQVLAGKGD